VFSAVVSLICSLTLTDWGSWSAIVASIIVVIGVIIGSIFKVKYFIEKHMLFKVEN
jgi:uncharacterized membrane protein